MVAASRDKPSWIPSLRGCHAHYQPTARPSRGDSRQQEADVGLPCASALPGLAQRGTRISLNPNAEFGKVWTTGTPKSLGGKSARWSLFLGPPQTSSAPHARASLPASPPHQAFLSPAYGPDLTPGIREATEQAQAQNQMLVEATWCRFPLSQPEGGAQGGPS